MKKYLRDKKISWQKNLFQKYILEIEHAQKKENNTPDSHLVPHGSTKGASSSFASEFGMGSGALCSLWSFSRRAGINLYINILCSYNSFEQNSSTDYEFRETISDRQ